MDQLTKTIQLIHSKSNQCLGTLQDIGLRITETDKYGAYMYCNCAMCNALRTY